MSDENYKRQDDELDALKCIYEHQFIRSNGEGKSGGQLLVIVNLSKEFQISYPAAKLEKQDEENDEKVPENEEKPADQVITLKHLPPIILNFTLPEGYPSKAPPTYTISCKWLTAIHLSRLCGYLDKAWDEQEVLWDWYDLLSNDILEFLQIPSIYELPKVSCKYVRENSKEGCKTSIDLRAIPDTSTIDSLVNYLIDYDEKESLNIFEKTYFDCGVCFTTKSGVNCVAFPTCKHVYCKECVASYFEIQIKEGSVRALTCPEEKCDTQADPELVKSLVSSETFEKYDRFLLKVTLECMTDIVYCPRTSCQFPVLKEHEQSMGRCPQCNFVFCIICKRTYHGVENCHVSGTELLKLREQYLNGTDEEKALLEKRYGKKKLQQAVEEHFSETWLETFSKKCPTCETNIQKIDGCNKMMCYKCRENFCWLCGRGLPAADPYAHFSDTRYGCFNKLFEGIVVENEFDESDDEDGWVNFVPID